MSHTEDTLTQLARVKRELAEVKMERDLLKKAAADSTGRRNRLAKSFSGCFIV